MLNNWKFILLLCITLGLAPFTPEPHIVGKIRWVTGNSSDMKLTDWFDLILHGLPFVLLFRFIILNLFKLKKSSDTALL